MSTLATTENHGQESFIETGEEEDHQLGEHSRSVYTEEGKTILGASSRVFCTGIIRAGVKVIKNSCSAAEKTKFLELEAKGMAYDEIDRALGGTPKSGKSKLFPANADYFTIRDCDFENPADAQFIRDNYADPKDGKVREIPIWLSKDKIADVIPHNYNAFDGIGNIRAYSFFDRADNQMLKYVPKTVGDNPQKSDWITVPFEDPDTPPKDAPAVKFGGNYFVRIKGIKGAGEIKVAIRSWNGIKNSIAVLKEVRASLGRFNNTMNRETFLVLKKVQRSVKAPDGKHQLQWITTIDASVDMEELVAYAESRPVRGFTALNQFNGVRHATISPRPAITETATPKETATPPATGNSETTEQKRESAPASSAKAGESVTMSVQSNITDKESQEVIDALYKMTASFGLTDLELEAYANFKLRQSLNREKDVNRLRKLKAELEMRLNADKATVKARCQDLLKENAAAIGSSDPEIDGMLKEFTRLADNNNLPVEHFMAHLTALSGGIAPADLDLEQAKAIYQEVSKRIEHGNIEQFKVEIAGNYRQYARKAA